MVRQRARGSRRHDAVSASADEDRPQARLTLADVYERHVVQIYGFFTYRVASKQTAEDLTQATFERALNAWGRYDPSRSRPLTWLLAIARNLLIDHYRADRSASHVDLDEHADAIAGEPSRLPGPSPRLETAIATLTDRERELVALKFAGELTGPEIAEITGLTLVNVQQVLSRAQRKLRAELEQSRD